MDKGIRINKDMILNAKLAILDFGDKWVEVSVGDGKSMVINAPLEEVLRVLKKKD